MKADLDLGLLRRHRIRLIKQTEVTECGLAALAMVAQYHGLHIDLGTLRQRFQVSLRGATLKSLIATADAMGLASRALKLSLSQLDSLVVPAILHWDMKHFVVVEKVSHGRALIHDPAGHSRWLPFEEISRHFTGVALELVPSDDFEPSDQTAHLRLRQLWHRITGLKRALLQTLVLSLVMQVFVLASPYYMQVAVDQALPALDRDLIAVLALGFGIFTLINAGAFLLRSFVIMSAGASLGFGISVNVGRRLLRLPIAWFERRHIGDVLSRFQSINPIRQFMTEGAIGSVLDGMLALATLAVMLFYSVKLTFVALAAFALYGLVRLASFSAQRSAQEEAIAATGQEQSVMIETLRGIVTLRLYNKEAARSAFWQARLTEALNANVGLARITAWQGASNVLIMGVETILSTWLAVRLVIDGGFSIGMVFAFLAYKTQFLQKASSLTDQLIGFRMLRLHLERLSDIALAPPDPSFNDQALVRRELKGRLELREIRFRYGPSDAWTLDGVNLLVEPGENIVISGPSGGGKSTLLKIILGLIEPDEGEVLVDGIPLVRFGHKHFHDQVGAVLQDDSLFAGSLMNNIALFDDEPDQIRAYDVARMASVHDDIATMPMRYETLVGDMGSTLSGGQRQRLLLARALYRRPRMLIIDEGTSHLDPAREQSVNSAIGSLGITRISVAHRLETVLSGDRQYSLRDGTLVEITGQMHALTHN